MLAYAFIHVCKQDRVIDEKNNLFQDKNEQDGMVATEVNRKTEEELAEIGSIQMCIN